MRILRDSRKTRRSRKRMAKRERVKKIYIFRWEKSTELRRRKQLRDDNRSENRKNGFN